MILRKYLKLPKISSNTRWLIIHFFVKILLDVYIFKNEIKQSSLNNFFEIVKSTAIDYVVVCKPGSATFEDQLRKNRSLSKNGRRTSSSDTRPQKMNFSKDTSNIPKTQSSPKTKRSFTRDLQDMEMPMDLDNDENQIKKGCFKGTCYNAALDSEKINEQYYNESFYSSKGAGVKKPVRKYTEDISLMPSLNIKPSRSKTLTTSEEKRLIKKIKHFDIEELNPDEIMDLIKKETDDVDIFSRINHDVYIPMNPGCFSAKKKLEKLNDNSEAMQTLYHQLLVSTPSADEAQNELTPEALSKMIYLMSQKVNPSLSPAVHFNTLFETGKWDESIKMSPVTQGYFQDVVVPLDSPKTLHEELITRDVRIATRQMKNNFKDKEDQKPRNDLFSEINSEIEADPEKIKTNLELSEEPPWGPDDFTPAVNALGAEPICVLDPTDQSQLDSDEAKTEAMKKGIEYYIESKTPLYSSTVTLRGAPQSGTFPGYVYAVPNVDQAANLAKSPSEVFQRAWQMCHPNCFKGDSIVVDK